MKALITGASSGIGKHMAYYLASKNIDLILVARNKKEMEKIKKNVQVAVKIYSLETQKKGGKPCLRSTSSSVRAVRWL